MLEPFSPGLRTSKIVEEEKKDEPIMNMDFLPDLMYNKLQKGNIFRRTVLDEILDVLHIPYEEYILYVKAVKVSSNKPNDPKNVYLVLTKNSICTIWLTDDQMGYVTKYSYV